MNKILKPSIRLMNRLKYVEKFTLIFVIFLMPIAAMMLLNISQANKEYEFTKKQRIGLEYNIALRTLIQHVQQHRGLTAVYLDKDFAMEASIKDKENEITKDIQEVDSINKNSGETLKVYDEWLEVERQWSNLKAATNNMSLDEAYDAHTRLITTMLSLNNHVSDNSKLIIQNRLECYYLVDLIVNKQTMETEYMGQARAIGAGAAGRKSLTETEKNRLLSLNSTISNSLEENSRAMNIAFSNSDIKQALQLPYSDANKSINEMLSLLNKNFLTSKYITMDSKEYFDLTTSSINKLYDLLIAESKAVTQITNNDFNHTIQKRNSLIIFTSIILAFLIYLFVGFYYSIKWGITAIEVAADNIASGKLTERVQLEAQDETQKIGNALNKMLNTLIKNYTEVKAARNALEKLAHYDNLTGLANRALFLRKLECIVRETKNNKMLALLYLDLDKFKYINDTLGHAMGDVVLRTIALRLSDIIGNSGTVCRLGGDEFTILLPDIESTASIEELITNLTTSIEKPILLNGENHSVGASIGYALYPRDAGNSEDLLKKADSSMYNIKQQRKIKSL